MRLYFLSCRDRDSDFQSCRDRDSSRLWFFKVVETETHRDSDFLKLSRPRLIETQEYGGCRDRDPSRLGKSCRDRDFFESLAIHWFRTPNPRIYRINIYTTPNTITATHLPVMHKPRHTQMFRWQDTFRRQYITRQISTSGTNYSLFVYMQPLMIYCRILQWLSVTICTGIGQVYSFCFCVLNSTSY